ncbi:hypothetical protein D9611_002397 [Ephemerocybe angulata]|uniref:Protein EFR3 n=1 Tax=Ephemerocybe angulata TaxID=980116 RepID=A0A8H5C1J3_9AGAR|nr:hypothetical protein D9611_002397 [Tulosesus angulatus]
MHYLFTPNHVQLLNACYPPTSSLLTAGPAYAPSSHELSRLTYYASNHPGKLTKFGDEVEKRIRSESRKAKAGNIRARASLLISLEILRSLATECRSDISLLSPALVTSVNVALSSLPQDLEVVARLARVFTAWTTFTNGHLVGADQSFTDEYMAVLQQFADLASNENADNEVRNRTRLIGFAAVAGVLNSEALYNDLRQFRAQTSILTRPILVTLFQTSTTTLQEQASTVKDSPGSKYLEELRRPAIERRAASIHLHVDGETGPSFKEVSDAALRSLFSLLTHAGGAQLGNIMQSAFDNLDNLKGWVHEEHCCWIARQVADWAQYQYRYAVPTWLVEKLLENQDAPTVTSLHTTLAAMVTTVFSSSTPMINLSSSDLMSKLLALLLRRAALSPVDALLPSTVNCIASLGRHVYYSDQIQDLAAEIINRLVMLEVQSTTDNDDPAVKETRSSSTRHLLSALTQLIRTANEHENDTRKAVERSRSSRIPSSLTPTPVLNDAGLAARRTRVSPDLWQDTLSLICDPDERVRSEYARSLTYYLSKEMQRHGEFSEVDGVRRVRRLHEGVPLPPATLNLFINSRDAGSSLLGAIHAYVYILVTNPSLAFGHSHALGHRSISSEGDASHRDSPSNANPPATSPARVESSSRGPRAKKASLMRRLTSSQEAPIIYASKADYSMVYSILVAIQEHLPLRGLLSAVPMLVRLDSEVSNKEGDPEAIVGIKTILVDVWTVIGRNWECSELSALCKLGPSEFDSARAVDLLVACSGVPEAFGVTRDRLRELLSRPWDAAGALQMKAEGSAQYDPTLRGDNLAPLLRISPALMKNDNMSIHSLARSTRGLGVTDLREALEGRAAMSNPNLGRPSSIVSTLGRASTVTGHDGDYTAPMRRSPSRPKRSPQGDVKDVLSKLGIGKQNGNLLKASFPAISKVTNQ